MLNIVIIVKPKIEVILSFEHPPYEQPFDISSILLDKWIACLYRKSTLLVNILFK